MSYHKLVARTCVDALLNPRFEIVSRDPYRNKYDEQGIRWVGKLSWRPFYISESQSSVASAPHHLATILSAPECLDQTKEPLYYAHRRFGLGIRIEAWHCGKWYQVFTPILPAECSHDSFSGIMRLLTGG